MLLLSILLGCLLVSGEAQNTSQTFSSTLNGFLIHYPAAWRKERPQDCGHDRRTADTENQLIITFQSDRGGKGDLAPPRIAVWYRAKLDEDSRRQHANRLSGPPKGVPTTDPRAEIEDSEFRTASGVIGIKSGSPDRNGAGFSSVGYTFVDGERMISLSCWDGGLGLRAFEPLFDDVARSLRFFHPFHEPPINKDGRARTARVDRARFEYPAIWSWTVRSDDDDVDPGIIQAPPNGNLESASVQLLFERKSLKDWEADVRKSFDVHAHVFDISPFVNQSGHQGLKAKATMGFGRTNIFTWFALPCSDGRLAVLFCWDHDNDDIDWNSAFEKIAQSIVVE